MSPFDPFATGLLTPEDGARLVEHFTRKLAPHFPFVLVPCDRPATDLARERPVLTLAVLAAASHDSVKLQRALSDMLGVLISSSLAHGTFATLDMLQGLLVNIAW